MSNRTPDQISELAEYKLSHERQIEALTKPGLSRYDRAYQFLCAIDLKSPAAIAESIAESLSSVAYEVWGFGPYELSLFGNLPNCHCPVIRQRHHNGELYSHLIPSRLPYEWSPSEPVLREFSRIQLEARFGRE